LRDIENMIADMVAVQVLHTCCCVRLNFKL
jgi:hypothetical protein